MKVQDIVVHVCILLTGCFFFLGGGLTGSVFSKHMSSKALLFRRAKTSACATHSFRNKHNMRYQK